MGFTVRSYAEIIKGNSPEKPIDYIPGFNNNVDSLILEHHKCKEIDQLQQPRRHQVKLIKKVIELLDKSQKDGTEKAKILTGVMLLVQGEIASTYKESLFKAEHAQNTSASVSSKFFFRLTQNMGRTSQNELTPEDSLTLVSLAKGFIESEAYNEGNSSKGFKLPHPFAEMEDIYCSESKITHYLRRAVKIVHEASEIIITRNEQDLEQRIKLEQLQKEKQIQTQHETESSNNGFLAKFFTAKPQVKAKHVTENEEKQQELQSA